MRMPSASLLRLVLVSLCAAASAEAGALAAPADASAVLASPGGARDDRFGRAVAAAAHGAHVYALVGAPRPGAVHAFARPAGGGGAWGGLGAVEAAGLGEAVAVDAGGAVALAGAESGDEVLVLTRSGSGAAAVWAVDERRLRAPLGIGDDDGFGLAVAVGGGGLVAAVGAPRARNGSGAAFVYSRANASSPWALALDVPLPEGDAVGMLGSAVAVSADGGTVAAGAAGSGTAAGPAGRVLLASAVGGAGGEWVTDAATLVASAGTPMPLDNGFGRAVSLSGDGLLLAVGAHRAGTGAVELFGRAATGAAWRSAAGVVPPAGEAEQFGVSLALAGDGTRLLVGTESADPALHSAWRYRREAGSLWRLEQRLHGPPGGPFDQHFGYSVALSGGGSAAALVGQFEASDSRPGAVYEFEAPALPCGPALSLGACTGWLNASAWTPEAGLATALARARVPGPEDVAEVACSGGAAVTVPNGTAVALLRLGSGATARVAGGTFVTVGTAQRLGECVGAEEACLCPAGSECAPACAADGVRPCPRGHYCPEDEFEATPCATGTSSNATSAESNATCELCAPGTLCDAPGTEVPEACPEGHFCPSPEAAAVACPPGTHNARAGRSEAAACRPCPAGSFCARADREPVPCEAPATCARGNMSAPEFCGRGQFCASPIEPARNCSRGTLCPGNTTRAEPCRAGSFCDSFDGAPSPCRAGSFCPGGGSAPVPCGPGRLCDRDNLTRPEACPPGDTCNDGVATPCAEPGRWCPVNSSRSVPCAQCGEGEDKDEDCTPDKDTVCVPASEGEAGGGSSSSSTGFGPFATSPTGIAVWAGIAVLVGLVKVFVSHKLEARRERKRRQKAEAEQRNASSSSADIQMAEAQREDSMQPGRDKV